ncbi:unnamed protein product [Mytilus edulis]|uniref:DZIP3-like HEPN domain-containing protein n=1 Tax=Mytilus edulis TaxID=6550 RepID=A0A8S3RYY2_MYTED|nr:unnamed protein product [Mytilus edulis]
MAEWEYNGELKENNKTMLSKEAKNVIRIGLLLSGISHRTVQVLFDRVFDPSCLDSSIINECRKLKDIPLKEILGESQWKLLFSFDGGSNSSTFVSALMVTVLRNLTYICVYLTDVLSICEYKDYTSKASEVLGITYYRNHLSKCEDGQIDSSFFKEAWSKMVGAVDRLGGQANIDAYKEFRDARRDYRMRLLKSWTVQDSHFVQTMSYKHISACLQKQSCVLVTSNSGCGKTIRPHCLALEIEDEAHNINVVYDLNKIISLNPGSFEIVKGTVIDKRIIHFPKK